MQADADLARHHIVASICPRREAICRLIQFPSVDNHAGRRKRCLPKTSVRSCNLARWRHIYLIFPPFSNVKGSKIKRKGGNNNRPKAQAGPPSYTREQEMQCIGEGHSIRAVSVMI